MPRSFAYGKTVVSTSCGWDTNTGWVIYRMGYYGGPDSAFVPLAIVDPKIEGTIAFVSFDCPYDDDDSGQFWYIGRPIMTPPTLLKSIVSREVDSSLYSIGSAVEVLANAAINFHGKAVTIMTTYYTNAKNAGVIDISTNGWTCAIDDICPWHPQIFQCVKAQTKMSTVQRI